MSYIEALLLTRVNVKKRNILIMPMTFPFGNNGHPSIADILSKRNHVSHCIDLKTFKKKMIFSNNSIIALKEYLNRNHKEYSMNNIVLVIDDFFQ